MHNLFSTPTTTLVSHRLLIDPAMIFDTSDESKVVETLKHDLDQLLQEYGISPISSRHNATHVSVAETNNGEHQNLHHTLSAIEFDPHARVERNNDADLSAVSTGKPCRLQAV